MRITQPKTKKEEWKEAIESAVLLLIALFIWGLIAFFA